MRTYLAKKVIVFSVILSALYLIIIELKLDHKISRAYLNFSAINNTNISQNEVEIPDIFRRNDLWRSSSYENKSGLDRWVFQREWTINVSRSEYMKSVKKKKRILVDGLFNLDDKDHLLPCDEDGVNFSQFCQLVEDLPLLPYANYDDFDAVLSRRDWNLHVYEAQAPPRLVSFFHIEESPYTLHEGDFRPNNPVLASYWRGSDIEVPYYKWIPFNNTTNSSSSNAIPEKNYAHQKYKLAAIVVSHCPTYNNRLDYVHQLQKYIPIDIYGSCGPLQCDEDCFENISRDYKFYLAFENANCRDYITEKFFINALGNEIVPVVLGAHVSDYEYAAPKKSFIHVEDYPSIKALADYLTLLDQNDDLYNEYFQWKGTGRIVNGHYDLFCRVCAFLYYADFHPPPRWPNNAYSWLQVNPCLKPGDYFWGEEGR